MNIELKTVSSKRFGILDIYAES